MSDPTKWRSSGKIKDVNHAPTGATLPKLPDSAVGEILPCKVTAVENATTEGGLSYLALWCVVKYEGHLHSYRHALFSAAQFSTFATFARLRAGATPQDLVGCKVLAHFHMRGEYLNATQIDSLPDAAQVDGASPGIGVTAQAATVPEPEKPKHINIDDIPF